MHGFTLNPTLGEFLLSQEDITIPRRGKIYSVNESNYPAWAPGVQPCLQAGSGTLAAPAAIW